MRGPEVVTLYGNPHLAQDLLRDEDAFFERVETLIDPLATGNPVERKQEAVRLVQGIDALLLYDGTPEAMLPLLEECKGEIGRVIFGLAA